MKTIHKFPLNIGYRVDINLPENAKLLHVAGQFDVLQMWVELDTSEPTVIRTFEVYGTGHTIFETVGEVSEHIGTVMMSGGELVFHAYEHKRL